MKDTTFKIIFNNCSDLKMIYTCEFVNQDIFKIN